eukprot:CAMPEP_0115039632 /NCGR_PEP_ID=MMETSP0216-20121206/44205_1 /TAXON_ID=223996 /ORGANISM="Protocruzia adherens, Strain Boccale" /LENGTH=40 /DNA_ID= /DNA_START= /DNA_END= /DNA_ORIENTATION=
MASGPWKRKELNYFGVMKNVIIFQVVFQVCVATLLFTLDP